MFDQFAHPAEVGNGDAVGTAVSFRLSACATEARTDERGLPDCASHLSGDGLNWDSDQSAVLKLLQLLLDCRSSVNDANLIQSFEREAVSLQLVDALLETLANQRVPHSSANQYELKNQLIYSLLRGHVSSVVLNQAKHLGIDLNQPRAVILIDATDYIFNSKTEQSHASASKQRVQTVINSIVSFFHLPNDTICADLGNGKVCVLKASNTKNLDPWATHTDAGDELGASWANLSALKRAADALLTRLRSDTSTAINIGIGRYHPGFQGLARSYEDARVALSLGRRFQGCNRVHCLGELGIAAFIGIADEETKIDLAKYLLSPLDEETELLATLDTFFAENCCPSSTAKRLSIHRNTLSYRLDKIASLTGLEPRKFDDAVQMRLSLLLRSLQLQSVPQSASQSASQSALLSEPQTPTRPAHSRTKLSVNK
ncbi:MAG: helix-turn-helix domain-containing protein [Elainella sp. C42_A2020_010]|nr:helix-turn-helix domain-containing protein [Elainella sp. C42_A2020_010]